MVLLVPALRPPLQPPRLILLAVRSSRARVAPREFDMDRGMVSASTFLCCAQPSAAPPRKASRCVPTTNPATGEAQYHALVLSSIIRSTRDAARCGYGGRPPPARRGRGTRSHGIPPLLDYLEPLLHYPQRNHASRTQVFYVQAPPSQCHEQRYASLSA